ncbi:methyltransferase family protein [Mycolicibacterium agri]|nr:methyltransferase dimerization domain-containing protein [Mycolicibacterium agri]
MTAAWVAQGIYTATKLGIPDTLRDKALTAEAIAEQVGANPDGVHRLLRALASHGVFKQSRDGTFALTAVSESLLTDAPNSARGMVLFWGDPLHWEHWSQLGYSGERAARPSNTCGASRRSTGCRKCRNWARCSTTA